MMSFAAPAPHAAFGGLGHAPGMPGGHSTDQRHFDARETRLAADREQELMVRLPHLVRSAKVAKGWAWLLSGVDARSVFSREALAKLPVLRRSDLALMQAGKPPFGGLVPEPVASFKRVFTSASRIYEPEATGYDTWRAARAMFAAGIRKGDIVLNCLSYHLATEGFIVDSGCRALGCPVIPAGPAEFNEELDARLAIIEHLAPVAFAGTAELIVRLVERASATGRDISSLRIAFIPEGGVEPAARETLDPHGIAAFEALTTPELGIVAYQGAAHDGFVLNEDLIAEIVHPGTGDPVEAGDAGELVITSFDPHHPFIRLATGMLTAELPGASASGHTNMRLAGWLGSADQAARIGQTTVTPAQIAQLRRRHPGIGRLRLTLRHAAGGDEAVLAAESRDHSATLRDNLAATLMNVAHIASRVELVSDRRLPNDGRVIADERG